MKEQILQILQSSNNMFTDLSAKHMHKLAPNFRGAALNTFDVQLPARTNMIITLTNQSLKENRYAFVANVAEAITLFSEENTLDADLEQLKANPNIAGFSPILQRNMSGDEMLQGAIDQLAVGRDLISSYLMVAAMPQF